MKSLKEIKKLRYEELKNKYGNQYLGSISQLTIDRAVEAGLKKNIINLHKTNEDISFFQGEIKDIITELQSYVETYGENVRIDVWDNDGDYSYFNVYSTRDETQEEFEARILTLREQKEYLELKNEFEELEQYQKLKAKYEKVT